MAAEAKENLFNLWMHNNKRFTTFIIHFKKEAYKTSWNYNALRFALCCALPQHIKDILCLASKQPSYNGYKALVTQINQQYWEDHSKYSAPQVPWNSSRNSNWQTGATAGNSTISAAPLLNFTAQPPLRQGLADINQLSGPCSQTQLNTADTQEALDPIRLTTTHSKTSTTPQTMQIMRRPCA
ncbi:hypothetical protein C0993_010507 [Termitomyces sp. T159_Od127]|nr:hypothetical protein C0993_010507 [Termitomyces sp. T159_Od127]